MAFEPNQGQSDSQVRFLARGRGYNLFLTSQETVLELKKPKAFPQKSPVKGSRRRPFVFPTPDTTEPTVLHLRMEGAQAGVSFEGQAKLSGISNYFIGKDRTKWLRRIPQYSKVTAHGVYGGVDVDYYGNQGKFEYDFVVQPGVDPGSIHLEVEGQQKVQLNGQGEIELQTRQGTVYLRVPVLYQEEGGVKNQVQGQYKLGEGGRFGFIVGNYDHSKPLVIDPVLDYSTYLGGTGEDWGTAVAADSNGNAYVVGYTQSADFPLQNPAESFGGAQNAFITEVDPTGSALVFSTYLGGTGYDDCTAITLDPFGDMYLTGYTSSTNFPMDNPLQGTLYGPYNAFITAVLAGGTDLGFSTYLGGSGEDGGFGIALDGNGNFYVTGLATSPDFPTLNAIQPTDGSTNGGTAFVIKINAGGGSAAYSTFLGGSNYDEGTCIAADANGDAWVGGYTGSSNFPLVDAFQPVFGGDQNAFITEVNAAGTAWAYSTYFGGSAVDSCAGIALDSNADIYFTGFTDSSNFPTQDPIEPTMLNPQGDAYVAELAAGGGSLVYSTYLGGSGNGAYSDLGQAIALDGNGDAFVTGYTASTDFPLVNPIQSSNLNTNTTAFITEVAAGGGSFLFSTYLGGSTAEQANGIAYDSLGEVVVTGVTSSTDFPTVNAFQPVNAGAPDAFVAKIVLSNPTSTPTATGTPTVTLTPTATPAVTGTPMVDTVTLSVPYPNPVSKPPVSVKIQAPTGSNVEWGVFTTSFRKILDVPLQPIPGNNLTLTWDLKDSQGIPVANGLYYLRVQVQGLDFSNKILKVLVAR